MRNRASEYEDCPPKADAMISSMRAFGYDLSMAVADLIDNSIYAGARSIAIDYAWNEGDPWFRILDDGNGMTEKRLREAMRLGTQSPLQDRDPSDMGRFGLGLKTASFSQCKLLTVCTKTADGSTAVRSWDLDHVCTCGKWELNRTVPENAGDLVKVLNGKPHGTVVLCQKLDRLTRPPDEADADHQKVFLSRFGDVSDYLETVFHRYLEGRQCVQIRVGRHICRPWDPFLKTNNFTYQLSSEYLDAHRVEVTPYLLPHVSKRTTQESNEGAGINGWNAQQGFYVYRNRRMIISGGYLDFPLKAEEHYKLCRIQIDLPNNLDHEWSLDVRKAAASPPANVRGDLERIARAVRRQAAEIYRARAGGRRKTAGKSNRQDVWVRERSGEKTVYLINRRNEAIERLLKEFDAPDAWAKKLFHLIENTVPHRLIIMDNAEFEDCQVDLPPEFRPPPQSLIELCRQIFTARIENGVGPDTAADFVCSVFDDHPAYRAAIDTMIEELTQ